MLARMNSFVVVALAAVVVLIGLSGIAQAALVADWSLTETSGTTAHDATGNGFNGTIGGSVTFSATGPFGNSFHFPGSSASTGSVTISDATGALNGTPMSQQTVSFWVDFPTLPSGTAGAVCAWNPSTVRWQYGVLNGNADVAGNVLSSSPGGQLGWGYATSSLTTNTWAMATFTLNAGAGQWSSYLNGQPMTTNTSLSGYIAANTACTLPSSIGHSVTIGNDGNTDEPLTGYISDAGIWNEALTPAKVAAMYNTPVLFGFGASNQYGQYNMSKLFGVWNNGTGGAGTWAVGSQTWQFAADGSLPGGHTAGQAWTAGGVYYVQLDGNAGGVETGAASIPEPSTLVLLAAGLAGLLAYAWRKRR